MNPARQEFWQIVVGAAVVLVVLAVVVMTFGSEKIVDDGRYELRARFGYVDGLKVGGTVMAAGVPVGHVVALNLAEGFRAEAVMRIDRAVRLDSDASAAVVTDGLFGNKFVRLDIGGGDTMIAEGGEVGHTEEPQILDDLLSQIIAIGTARQKERSGR
jgi:phospholipid/cholesterol/gamma-HCH transport system substrate-binding protein